MFRYLSQGGIHNKLEDMVKRGKGGKIHFDIDEFIDRILGPAIKKEVA